jgi:hypothetical protein
MAFSAEIQDHCAHGAVLPSHAEARRTRRTVETATDWYHTEGTEGTEDDGSSSVTPVPLCAIVVVVSSNVRGLRVTRFLKAEVHDQLEDSGIEPCYQPGITAFARRGNGGSGELILEVLRSLRSLCVSNSPCRRGLEKTITRRTSTPYCVTTVPIRTTWKSRPRTALSVASSSSFQRASGAPLTYQPLPLSASSMPYVFIARRITCTLAG